MTELATYLNRKLSKPFALVFVQAFIVLAVITLYSLSFFIKFNRVQSRQDASGFEHHYASHFFYFYWYTGYFPLATLDTSLVYSKEAAQNQIDEHGRDLIMEYQHWSRLGEHARIFCYLPDAFFRQSAEAPSIRLFNAIFFLLGLLIVYRGFYFVQKPLLGLLLVIMTLCTPYFHFELFRKENIFALQHCVFFIVLGLLLPLLCGKGSGRQHWVALIAAVVMPGFCSEIRNEISVVMICLVLMVMLAKYRLRMKFVFLATAIILFATTKVLIRQYFEHEYQQTEKLVRAKQGHVYTGKRISGHKFWHPVFCGLGDFDRKYGYAWNDTVAYRHAMPILTGQYRLPLGYSGKLHTDNFYDTAKLYYIKFDELPQYETIMKQKVLGDIRRDPGWYLQILLKRIIRIATHTLPLPGLGFLLLPVLIYLWRFRRWQEVKLLIVSLPLSATAFIIYSGKGSTYNAVFGYILIAVVVVLLLEHVKLKKAP